VQGVIKLIDAAKKAGVKKFVLQTSILTNGKAIGEGFNPIFLVLNAITGALDKKLEVPPIPATFATLLVISGWQASASSPGVTPTRCKMWSLCQ